MLFAFLLTAFALSGAVIGIRFGQISIFSPRLAAVGAGLLFGISLFWMLPEMVEQSGWIFGAGALCSGVLLLWMFDRFLHPICSSVSHHDHGMRAEPFLPGFALPLLLATGAHSILDGWSIRILAPNHFAGTAAVIGLSLHKIPEGFGLGLLTRESLQSTTKTLLFCGIAECFTLVGAGIEPLADHAGVIRFGSAWITGILALTGGSFLFLGYHALHGKQDQPGVISSFLLSFCVVAAIALVRWRFGFF